MRWKGSFTSASTALRRERKPRDGEELVFRRLNLTRDTVTAMQEAMDWPGCLFEEKWRAGKQFRECHVGSDLRTAAVVDFAKAAPGVGPAVSQPYRRAALVGPAVS